MCSISTSTIGIHDLLRRKRIADHGKPSVATISISAMIRAGGPRPWRSITRGDLEKDTRYPRVFISDHFYYFGENAPAVPSEYASLIQTRQGCRCCEDLETARGFIGWLENSYAPGVHGQPRDRNEMTVSSESPCLGETKELYSPSLRHRTGHRDDRASSDDRPR